jgi:hypothetical protein
MRVKLIKFKEGCRPKNFTIGDNYEVIQIDEKGDYKVYNNVGAESWLYKEEIEEIEDNNLTLKNIPSPPQKDQHYNNTNGSLYKFAQDHDLNAWEFDIIKRITRCRKKGQFKEDLEKTKRVIDLYLKEFEL